MLVEDRGCQGCRSRGRGRGGGTSPPAGGGLLCCLVLPGRGWSGHSPHSFLSKSGPHPPRPGERSARGLPGPALVPADVGWRRDRFSRLAIADGIPGAGDESRPARHADGGCPGCSPDIPFPVDPRRAVPAWTGASPKQKSPGPASLRGSRASLARPGAASCDSRILPANPRMPTARNRRRQYPPDERRLSRDICGACATRSARIQVSSASSSR